MASEQKYSQDIRCAKFCMYNKKLFCPFYEKPSEGSSPPTGGGSPPTGGGSPPTTGGEKGPPKIVPNRVKFNTNSIRPSGYKISLKDKIKTIQFMHFEITMKLNISSNVSTNSDDTIEVKAEGSMCDKYLGYFYGTFIVQSNPDNPDNPEEEEKEELKCDGSINPFSKECDFGGNIILYLNGVYDKLKGVFKANYKEGGILPVDENGNSVGDNSKLPNKIYTGYVDLGYLSGSITISTDM